MNVGEVRSRARAADIRPGKMRKAEMIRAIQCREGYQECYGADWRFDCSEVGCCWRTDCLTPSPG